MDNIGVFRGMGFVSSTESTSDRPDLYPHTIGVFADHFQHSRHQCLTHTRTRSPDLPTQIAHAIGHRQHAQRRRRHAIPMRPAPHRPRIWGGQHQRQLGAEHSSLAVQPRPDDVTASALERSKHSHYIRGPVEWLHGALRAVVDGEHTPCHVTQCLQGGWIVGFICCVILALHHCQNICLHARGHERHQSVEKHDGYVWGLSHGHAVISHHIADTLLNPREDRCMSLVPFEYTCTHAFVLSNRHVSIARVLAVKHSEPHHERFQQQLDGQREVSRCGDCLCSFCPLPISEGHVYRHEMLQCSIDGSVLLTRWHAARCRVQIRHLLQRGPEFPGSGVGCNEWSQPTAGDNPLIQGSSSLYSIMFRI
eukprot:m.691492 g.691492  ORF g.691492 m.691492 type:complete len:365 (+) comp22855_c0_seq15:90-1184(+)